MRASEFVTEAQAVKQRLDPKCWKGKHKEGTKIKGGVRVNNCVPNESVAEGSVKDINDIVGKYCAQQGITRNDLTNYDVKQLSKLSGLPTYYIRDQLIKTSPGVTETAAWQKKSGKNKNGGLNKKGVASYRKEHPGSKLQTAVTIKPSQLKPGSKSAKRRKSFCARMKGMKKHNTSAKTAHDPDSRINKSLRKWNCE